MAFNKTEFEERYVCDHFHTVMEAVEYDSETNDVKFGQDTQLVDLDRKKWIARIW